MVPWQRALARLRLADRDTMALGEFVQSSARTPVENPAPGDHYRALCSHHRTHRRSQIAFSWRRRPKFHDGRLEEIKRIIEGVGLYILRKGQSYRPAERGIGQSEH